MIRKEVLEEAIRCVCTDRNVQYGEPEDSFEVIAGLWNSYVESACVGFGSDVCIGGGDVAIMMALFKIGRMITSADQKRDTFVDAAGYIACAAQILLPKEEEGDAANGEIARKNQSSVCSER